MLDIKNMGLTNVFLVDNLFIFLLEIPNDFNFDDLLDVVHFEFEIHYFHLLEQNLIHVLIVLLLVFVDILADILVHAQHLNPCILVPLVQFSDFDVVCKRDAVVHHLVVRYYALNSHLNFDFLLMYFPLLAQLEFIYLN